MKKQLTLSAFAAVTFLGACATLTSGQMQHITVLTPGEKNARCTLYNGETKYDVYTNQTINVQRAPYDLMVRCLAAGNREKTVVAEWTGNAWVILNVANGLIPGVTYDLASNAAYSYPKEVVVSFEDVAFMPYDMPDYMKDGLKDLDELYNGEYMGPTIADVPADIRESDVRRKAIEYNLSPFESEPAAGESAFEASESVVPYDKKEEKK
ncbi:MAG: hypothetical protein AAF549_09045 [Pseudomonadota bacterium]